MDLTFSLICGNNCLSDIVIYKYIISGYFCAADFYAHNFAADRKKIKEYF